MKVVRTVLVALLLAWVVPAFALVAVPQLTGRVVDQTGTLSSGDIAQLTQKLADLERRKGSQIAILIVPTTDGEAIEPFSLRVAEIWKIGRKKVDDGALLVVAKNDRRLRIEVGYGLEGVLTDVTTKRIIDECYDKALRLLSQERARLDALAEVLLREESLDYAEMLEVTGLPPHAASLR